MKFRDADDVIGRYFRARKRASSPRGTQVAQRGRSYAKRCANRRCGLEGKPIDQPDGAGELVKRCPRCGEPWKFSDVFALAGQSHSGRGGRPPRPVLEAGDLVPFVSRLVHAGSLEPGHARVFLTYVADGRYSHRSLAERLTEEGYLGQRWQTRDVRRAVERSRAVLERDLARRGVLDR